MIVKIESVIYMIVLSLSLMLLTSCVIQCNDCLDNLSEIYNNCAYVDGDIATFINSDGKKQLDTVFLSYEQVPNEYCYSITGKEPVRSSECVGNLIIYIGDFKLYYHTNLLYDNELGQNLSFDNMDIDNDGYDIDVIEYNLNDKLIKCKDYVRKDTICDEGARICIECIISQVDMKLIEYTLFENETLETYYLEE